MIDYFGEVRFSEEELKQMAEGVEKARAFYAKRGIDYIIVVAPNKEAMYSEYMPDRLQKQRVRQIADGFGGGISAREYKS